MKLVYYALQVWVQKSHDIWNIELTNTQIPRSLEFIYPKSGFPFNDSQQAIDTALFWRIRQPTKPNRDTIFLFFQTKGMQKNILAKTLKTYLSFQFQRFFEII